jgi:hypothetical protein
MTEKTISIRQEAAPKIHSARELNDFSVEQVQRYLSTVIQQPDPGLKFMDMFMLLQNLGFDDFSLEIQEKALTYQRHFRLLDPPNPRLRVLALFGPGNMQQNAPLDFVLYGSHVTLDVLYLSEQMLESEQLIVPDHDVAILAMSASTQINPILRQLHAWTPHWPRPLLNNVTGILQCERDVLHTLLSGIPGLSIPPTRRLNRGDVSSLPPGFLVRPVDTHAGTGFEHVQSAADLLQYLDTHVADSYFVSTFVDYRDASGVYRKNRIALIDKKPYICHRASADHWMISYKNAHMELSQSKRDDEKQFMESFDHAFVRRHAHALEEMASRIHLDYVVLDCAETPAGELLIFEADTAGWIHATDPISMFPYKTAVMERAFTAFELMLDSAYAAHPPLDS